MAKRMKRAKRASKVVLNVGSRVKHATDPNLIEGVIVHLFGDGKPLVEGNKTTYFVQHNVHWSNGERGVYYAFEINKIKPKTAMPTEALEKDSSAKL